MSQSNGYDPAVTVVVPAKNEAGNIAPLVAEIASALQGRAFEIVYINDGSSDGTETELRDLMAQRPWLRQIWHAQSCGQSAAVRTGVAMARAPIIVTLDGDGQNDPALPSGSHHFTRSGWAASRPCGRTAYRPQGDGLQETAVTDRQQRARRNIERWHPGFGMRPEGVSPRSFLVAALFRWPSSFPAGAGAA